jgi:NADP-dependent 3-hydroxy acid dehydrogenase YdfG
MSKKVAFITGATVGLGQVLTQVFIDDGYPMKGLRNASNLARLMACLSLEQTSRVTGQVWSIEGEFSTIRPIVK